MGEVCECAVSSDDKDVGYPACGWKVLVSGEGSSDQTKENEKTKRTVPRVWFEILPDMGRRPTAQAEMT